MTAKDKEQAKIWLAKYGNFLTQVQRQALQLHLEKNLSISDIADEIATSRQAAHDAIKKGLEKLRVTAAKLTTE